MKKLALLSLLFVSCSNSETRTKDFDSLFNNSLHLLIDKQDAVLFKKDLKKADSISNVINKNLNLLDSIINESKNKNN